jgi:predicted MFS family arabinose efflux permease
MSGAESPERLNTRHWVLLLLLATVQFTHIVDFMIIMPLGPKLLKSLVIDKDQFSWVLSSYGLAAVVAGLVLAPLLNGMDRKRALLVLFAGFTLGTWLCAFAPSFAWLLLGRIVAGGFGGVAGATVLAIIGDAFPLARRGTATGAVMSAFSLATIAGVPLGLALAGESADGWRTPFVVLATLSMGILALALLAMPPIRGHLRTGAEHRQGSMRRALTEPAYLRAYALMFTLHLSGFLIFSFMALFLVNTVGLPEKKLWLVYFLGGIATLVSMNVIGRLSDRFPRVLVFQVLAAGFIVPVLLIAYLPPGTSLALVLALTTLVMVLGSGRGIPSLALITSIATNRDRGTFLSVNSSVQQLAISLGPLVAALMLSGGKEGEPLLGFEKAAWCSAVLSLACCGLVWLLHPAPPDTKSAAEPEPNRLTQSVQV